MDRIAKERRSWNMSRIKGKNTIPELKLRSFLHKNGFRFRIHDDNLIGKPDIVLPKYKTVIFVHGCFWHRHKGCKFAYTPKTSVNFWKNKFRDNVRRFSKVVKKLTKLGWRVVTIWECEVDSAKKRDKLCVSLQKLKCR